MKYSRDLGLNTGIELVKLIDYTDVEKELSLPSDYNLNQNYPNPFNPTTRIKYSLKNNGIVNLSIYDVRGKLVGSLLKDEFKSAGEYEVVFDASQLSSGVYYYQLKSANNVVTQKMILIK